jgi:hypothetical protein
MGARLNMRLACYGSQTEHDGKEKYSASKENYLFHISEVVSSTDRDADLYVFNRKLQTLF